MIVQTKEMSTLRLLFPEATHIGGSLNSNQDGHYRVWLFLGFDEDQRYSAESEGFNFDHVSPHLTDNKNAELCVSFVKNPDCKWCGNIEHKHNAQQAGIFCQEEYQKGLASLTFTPESELERYRKYGKEYYQSDTTIEGNCKP